MVDFDVFVKASGIAQPLCLTQVSADTAREGSEEAAKLIAAYRRDHPDVVLDWVELRGLERGSVFAAWRLDRDRGA